MLAPCANCCKDYGAVVGHVAHTLENICHKPYMIVIVRDASPQNWR